MDSGAFPGWERLRAAERRDESGRGDRKGHSEQRNML